MTAVGPRGETSAEMLDRLRGEVAELRASRERLVLAGDADLCRIERDVHEGVQQHLVALAVNLQLGEARLGTDPAAAMSLLEELGRDVQHALDETARLAQRIYAPLLEASGLAATLRAAAVTVGVPASVEVAADGSCPPEVALTVYRCWLAVLEQEGGAQRATISVREEDGVLAFEIAELTADAITELERRRDRVEALGGRLTIRPEPGRGIVASGSLPLAR